MTNNINLKIKNIQIQSKINSVINLASGLDSLIEWYQDIENLEALYKASHNYVVDILDELKCIRTIIEKEYNGDENDQENKND